MEWKIRIHRKALKFFEEIPGDKRSLVEERLSELLEALERGILPYRRLDIRKLRGEWKGFLRMRVGDIRIIFKIDFDAKIIYVYHIHYRGKAYK
ncbi:MAG: type II toxin-antitoxin system RelE/ParE family toxin [Thermoprotei archaeon]